MFNLLLAKCFLAFVNLRTHFACFFFTLTCFQLRCLGSGLGVLKQLFGFVNLLPEALQIDLRCQWRRQWHC